MGTETVVVRRQWNDWRRATYNIDDITGLHWTDTSGGICAPAPQAFLYGYVQCDAMVSGELAHSCMHGKPPHQIKVCVVKKDNTRAVFEKLAAAIERDRSPRPGPDQQSARLRTAAASLLQTWLAENGLPADASSQVIAETRRKLEVTRFSKALAKATAKSRRS